MVLVDGFLWLDWQTWLSIGIGAVITVVVAVLVYRLQKTPRTLDYAIRSTQDLTPEASPHLKAHMEIIWKEGQDKIPVARTLEAPTIVNYRVCNTGKRAIDADDFKSPIKVTVKTGEIIDVVVTNVSHEGILALGSIPSDSNGSRIFTPALMNPRDWIEIQVITDRCGYPPKLSCWVREEARPMQRQEGILYPPLLTVAKRQFFTDRFVAFWTILGTVAAALSLMVTILTFVASTR